MRPEPRPLDSPTSAERGRPGPAGPLGGIPWAVGFLAAWTLLVVSLMQDRQQWLTALNLVTTHGGLFVLLNARRLGHRRLARASQIAPMVTLVLSAVALVAFR
ncbi:hypothetical protein FCH28_30255 [Streptomyces piniterrae]|uniref:Uncharacterized protein n=1 Tax=Streptomyces piniterrae TaxID=2571125 RepID=A0A4U0MUC0_9ACTN|nr:hypothetical protein [Streptomyces piniterrae]TJZ44605.1 hypothetical protein FCH28_30255 [Streptomyces piniterrae]